MLSLIVTVVVVFMFLFHAMTTLIASWISSDTPSVVFYSWSEVRLPPGDASPPVSHAHTLPDCRAYLLPYRIILALPGTAFPLYSPSSDQEDAEAGTVVLLCLDSRGRATLVQGLKTAGHVLLGRAAHGLEVWNMVGFHWFREICTCFPVGGTVCGFVACLSGF